MKEKTKIGKTKGVKKLKRKRRRNSSLIISIFIVIVLILIGKSVFSLIDKTSLIINDQKEDIEINDETDKGITEGYEEDIVVVENLGYLRLEEDPKADDARQVQEMIESWDYLREDGKKVAYLTFDDGPSDYVTEQVLDILKANDVKATFFALGSMIEKSDNAKTILKRIAKEGHAIGNHGYSHNYDVLYPGRTANVENFMADMNKSEAIMKSVLGEDFSTRVLRFPGGHRSWNTDELDIVLDTNNYASVDWNSLNGDAEGEYLEASQLLNRLESTVSELYGNDDVIVVLMHDTDAKESTAEYLQSAIDYLKMLGYEFRTLK